MPTRTLNNEIPAYAVVHNGQLMLAGVAYGRDADIITIPFTTVVGTPTVTDPIIVVGYNGFMLAWTGTGAGTETISYDVCDPDDQTTLVTRQIIAGQVTGGPFLFTFGAFSAIGASDVFHTIRLRFAAAVANTNTTALRLWAGTR